MNLKALWTRAILKRDYGVCQRCLSQGIMTPATDAHHIIHKTGGLYLRYHPDNGVALCRSCHDLDAQGKLLEWCIEHIGEKRYYELKREGHKIVATNSFSEGDALRKLESYLKGGK
jgi:hypothetical protein